MFIYFQEYFPTNMHLLEPTRLFEFKKNADQYFCYKQHVLKHCVAQMNILAGKDHLKS